MFKSGFGGSVEFVYIVCSFIIGSAYLEKS
jgi:hypothetical protein